MVRITVTTIVAIASLASMLSAAEPVAPSHGGGLIEKTVMCPEWVTETRIVKETHYRQEERARECVTYKNINVEKKVCTPITVWVKKDMVDEQRYTVTVPKYEMVDEEYIEMVDGTLDITKYKTVTRCVPVTKTKTVCECQGQWVEREVETCGPCGARCVRKVTCYEPKMVERQVEYTCQETICEKVPYTCTIETCEPVVKIRKVKRIVNEEVEKVHKYNYVTYVPLQKFQRKTVCVKECVPETKVVTETVCVPYEVEKEVEVRVCKMVPKTILVPSHCQ